MTITRCALIAVAALTVALAGCGGGGNKESATTTEATTGTTPSGQTVQVTETEYKITPNPLTIPKAGTYTIEATNDGTVTHALTVEGNGLEETRTGDIEPGETESITVALMAGTYKMYCPIDSHQKNGMHAKLVVG